MPMKTEHDFVAEIARQVNYAAKSFSIELMHEAFGYCKACRECGMITAPSYVSLSSTICRDWLNNGKWKTECELYSPDYCGKRKTIRRAILKEKGID